MSEPNCKQKCDEITTDENGVEWTNLGKPLFAGLDLASKADYTASFLDGCFVDLHNSVEINADQLTYKKLVVLLAEMDAALPRPIARQRWFEPVRVPPPELKPDTLLGYPVIVSDALPKPEIYFAPTTEKLGCGCTVTFGFRCPLHGAI